MYTYSSAMRAAAMAGVIGLLPLLASQAIAGGFASATNTDTGVTVTSVANPDGSHTVTATASVGGVAGPAVPAADTPEGDFASSTDPDTGVTTTSVANADGTHTVTAPTNGNEGPADAGASGDEEPASDGASNWSDDFEEWGDDDWDDSEAPGDNAGSNDQGGGSNGEDGSPTVTIGADGSRTVTWTNADGQTITEETDPNDDVPGGKKVTVDYPGGYTYRGPMLSDFGWVHGRRVVTMYDFDGLVISEDILGPEEAWAARRAESESSDGGEDEAAGANAGDFDPFEQFRVPADVIEYIESILAEEEGSLEEPAGDGNHDDSGNSWSGALNSAPHQNAIQNATAVAIQTAQRASTANAVRQATQHAGSYAAAHVAAEAARPHVSTPSFTLSVGVR